ncbi:MAG: DUF4012 domain-containing protein [Parcubacteria group bacterium]|nr:DUF4012 domain-containing protein [Parcubacteria group bacterium]
MKRVPKNNISLALFDIKHPDGKIPASLIFSSRSDMAVKIAADIRSATGLRSAAAPVPERGRKSSKKRFRIALALAAAFSVSLFFVLAADFLSVKKEAASVGRETAANFKAAAKMLFDFEPERSSDILKSNQKNLERISRMANGRDISAILSAAGAIVPEIKNIPKLLGDFLLFGEAAVKVSASFEILKNDGLNMAMSGRGEELIGVVESIEKNLETFESLIAGIKNRVSELKGVSGVFSEMNDALVGDYVASSSELYGARRFAAALAEFLKSYDDRHLLILFQNPSEIRPGGGFIGSYADITINRGSVKKIDVRDIYDPDGQLDAKVVPPKQLRSVTGGWGARDANWFFDFPVSAEKIIGFLEESKMYKEKMVSFDGAIAVNINLLKDLLEISGPIRLPEYGTTIDKDNFLLNIQREVETGNDKKSGEPKRILKVLAPILLERFSGFSGEEKKIFIEKAIFRAAKKDIMVYFKNPEFQEFSRGLEITGAVYETSPYSADNYLAVVNANVAGGKSDALINQTIKINSSVGIDGKTVNELKITRAYRRWSGVEPFWNAVNKNFTKVFVPAGSRLLSLSGNVKRRIYDPINYEKNGYVRDADLEKAEKTAKFDENFGAETLAESGKTVFAAWLDVSPGGSGEIAMEYENPNKLILEEGRGFQFVFERQSGVGGVLEISVEAPPGFKWKESNKTVFEYKDGDPDKRIILPLTLMKIRGI